VEQVLQHVQRRHERGAERDLLEAGVVRGQHLEQHRQVGRVPLAGHVAFAEADGAVGDGALDEVVVVHDEPRLGAGLRALQADLPPVGQDEIHRPLGPVGDHRPRRRPEHKRCSTEVRHLRALRHALFRPPTHAEDSIDSDPR
jgi:hypothetical protein